MAVDGERPTLTVPFVADVPAVDATRDDAVWRQAAVIEDLSPPLGVTFERAPARTRVEVLWSRSDLFLRFRCAGAVGTRLPDLPADALPRDLPYFKADCVEIFLDPVGDARQYIEMQFSPDGGVFDGVYLFTAPVESDGQGLVRGEITGRDGWFFKEWDLDGLRVSAAAQGAEWTVVVAIPARSLLKRRGAREFAAGMELRVNLVRFAYPAGEGKPVITNWARVVEGRAHRSPQGCGTLVLQAPAG
jgi:hypothetical protein